MRAFKNCQDLLSDLCWSWNFNTLATWCKELTHWKRAWCWERLKAGGAGDDRRWAGWMASLTRWTWVWASSGSWWWTGKPGVLQSMGSQRAGRDWDWTELNLATTTTTTSTLANETKSQVSIARTWTLLRQSLGGVILHPHYMLGGAPECSSNPTRKVWVRSRPHEFS